MPLLSFINKNTKVKEDMYAEVIVDIAASNVDKIFDYNVDGSLCNKIKVGIRVEVPFGNRILEGFVLEIKNKSK